MNRWIHYHRSTPIPSIHHLHIYLQELPSNTVLLLPHHPQIQHLPSRNLSPHQSTILHSCKGLLLSSCSIYYCSSACLPSGLSSSCCSPSQYALSFGNKNMFLFLSYHFCNPWHGVLSFCIYNNKILLHREAYRCFHQ